jgi:hypothetical protein
MVKGDPSLGEKSFNYVKNNHSTDMVFGKLLSQITASRLLGGDIENYVDAFRVSYSIGLRISRLLRKIIRFGNAV